ncbi:MAG: adenosylcobinamide-GDP ribazoletransferase [Halobacteriota archaeon]
MLDIIGFLTQIPVRKEVRIEEVAAKSYLFPFVALLIGALISVMAFLSFGFLLLPAEIAALLTLLSIYLITGLMHLDGLADFFDGVMAGGSRREKIKAMKDEKIGISGLFAAIVILLLNLFCIKTICSGTTVHDFARVFIIAEVSAKLSMNTCMFFGKGFKEGIGGGMGDLFIRSVTSSKYAVALLSSIIISFVFTNASFLSLSVLTGIIVAVFMSCVAKNNFGMVSGDAMGASNEIARCVTLLVFVLVS